MDAVRRHRQGDGTGPTPIPEADYELIERHLLRVTLSAKQVIVHLRQNIAESEPAAPGTI
jgi:hypothetical protein